MVAKVKRSHLICKIQRLDLELRPRVKSVRQDSQQRLAKLRTIPPFWLVAGGLFSGFLIGRIDTTLSPRLVPSIINMMQIWHAARRPVDASQAGRP
jgi:hypothetical protein